MPNLSRWSAEPTRFIFLPASSFVPNLSGYPVLAKSAQEFIKNMAQVSHVFLMQFSKVFILFAQHRPTIILTNTQAGLHLSGGSDAYPQYVRHLEKASNFNKALETPGSVEVYAQGYQDYLQSPLQVRLLFLPTICGAAGMFTDFSKSH